MVELSWDFQTPGGEGGGGGWGSERTYKNVGDTCPLAFGT